MITEWGNFVFSGISEEGRCRINGILCTGEILLIRTYYRSLPGEVGSMAGLRRIKIAPRVLRASVASRAILTRIKTAIRFLGASARIAAGVSKTLFCSLAASLQVAASAAKKRFCLLAFALQVSLSFEVYTKWRVLRRKILRFFSRLS